MNFLKFSELEAESIFSKLVNPSLFSFNTASVSCVVFFFYGLPIDLMGLVGEPTATVILRLRFFLFKFFDLSKRDIVFVNLAFLF